MVILISRLQMAGIFLKQSLLILIYSGCSHYCLITSKISKLNCFTSWLVITKSLDKNPHSRHQTRLMSESDS